MTVPVAAQHWRDRVALVSLISAEAISNIGSRMSFFAIPWLVLVTTGDPIKIGTVAGAETLAYLVSGVLAAPLLDRLGARLSSIGADLLSVVIAAAIATFGQLDFRVLVVLVTIFGVTRSQGDRAKVTLVVPLMGKAGDYPRVASIRDGVMRSSILIGSSTAGIAIAFLGATGAIWLDAASFATAALAVVAVRSPEKATEPAGPTSSAEGAVGPTSSAAAAAGPTSSAEGAVGPAPAQTATDESYLGALRNGFAWFRANRLLRGITAMLFFTSLFNQAVAVVFVPLWVITYMGDSKALGAISTAYALGVITGSAVFAWLSPILPRYPMLAAGYIIGGAPRFLVLALSDDLPVVLVVTLLCGVFMCTANPTVTAAIYQRTPKDMLARAGGIITAIAFGGLPIGGLVGGVLVQTLGLSNGILTVSMLFLLVTMAPVVGYGLWREVNDTASKRPSPGSTATVHRLYAAAGVATGLRLKLRYAHGRWSITARLGLRTVVRRRPVEPKVAVTALHRLDFQPVRAAVGEVLLRDRVAVSRQTSRVRRLIRRAQADLGMISNADR